jgi:hypothetical protein
VGAYTITLTVCDAAGQCDSGDVSIDADATSMACFAVEQVSLSLGDTELDVQGTYSLGACSEVDVPAAGATFTVEGLTYEVPAGGFAAQGNSGRYRYKTPAWELQVDPGRSTWRFLARDFDGAALSPADGLSIALALGDQTGSQTVAPQASGGDWDFEGEPGATCAPADGGQGCNQGVGNGDEGCDPGNSNQGDPDNSNDENGGVPGAPGRKGGNGKKK